MIDNIMEKVKKVENDVSVDTAKYIITEDIPLNDNLLSFISDSVQFPNYNYTCTINELGKQLLQAAQEGNVEEIRQLLAKGAPFTADWLGTSPLHLAAQNNHINACEIFLRAGMYKDTRTKVERTPLHMAVYEGHLEVVDCLLKHGADPDAKDMLHMTPLHWAVQNGHAEIAATLIRQGASTTATSKFDLTPLDIALQMHRSDIVQIIKFTIRDPSCTNKNLAELNETSEAVEPIMHLNIENEETNSSCNELPLETVMLETETTPDDFLEEPPEHETNEVGQVQYPEAIESEPTTNVYNESMKLLQQHGITMLPVDESNILNSVMETGHSVVLTEAGKQALNSIKETEKLMLPTSQPSTALTKIQPPLINQTVKKKKIITVTADQFLAMTSNNASAIRIVNGKLVQNTPKQSQMKRIVMKKNKVVPLQNARSAQQHQTNQHINAQGTRETVSDVDMLVDQLSKAQAQVEAYRKKLLKTELELQKYKQKCKLLMDQNNLNNLNV